MDAEELIKCGARAMYQARRPFGQNENLKERFESLNKTTQNRYMAMSRAAYNVFIKTDK